MDYTTFKEFLVSENPIYLDTNCLLKFYELPVDLSLSLIDAISEKEVDSLIRISSTVKKEYTRNIKNKKTESGNTYNRNIENMTQAIEKVKARIREHNSNSSRCNNPTQPVSPDKLSSEIDLVLSKVKKLSEIDPLSVMKPIDMKRIDDFIDQFFKSYHLIDEPNQKEMISYINEGYTRAKHNVPPGYKDRKKYHDVKKMAVQKKKKSLSTEEIIDYLGDFFIWKDILNDHFFDSLDGKLFVTGDLKEDWFDIPEDKNLKNYSPRVELVREFECYHEKNISIEFLPFDLFVLYLIQISGNVDFESFFISTVMPSIESSLLNLIFDRLQQIVEAEMIEDGNVTMAMRVEWWEAETEEDSIEIVDFAIDSYEVLHEDATIHKVNFVVETKFSASGTFSADLELGGDYSDRSSGDFQIDSGVLVFSIDVDLGIEYEDNRPESKQSIEEIIPAIENKEIEKIISLKDYSSLTIENIFIQPGGIKFSKTPEYDEEPPEYF
ncbi:PIN-like domain-containing protein [Enterococcus devriesei]|uniref:PIN-like domain-containing protein n=1 Tax=Enterococcus devriesei TaxID=319970 RepID=UPI00289024AB|nr:PIN-like domain-containing protein [Enterococcus devriesei]MDT2823004.1 PIN-like domain-containing protein [Enterococcus devriesei]